MRGIQASMAVGSAYFEYRDAPGEPFKFLSIWDISEECRMGGEVVASGQRLYAVML